MTTAPLLAKSPSNGRITSLAGHTRAVLSAVRTMFGGPARPTRLAREWLRFFRLDLDDFSPFFRNLWVAAALHDIGKANDGFQRAVRGKGEQVIRHEHLSALILWEKPLRDWLRESEGQTLDPEIVAAAVASHHLKVSDQEFAVPLVDCGHATVSLLTDDQDVTEVLAMAAEGLAHLPSNLNALAGPQEFQRLTGPAKARFERDMHRFNRELRVDARRKRLLLALKAALIAADSAGSAVTRMGQTLDEWLSAAFGGLPLTEDDIIEGVIAPRVRELQSQGRWKGFHDFQAATGALGPRALLLSGCGSGKTLAAWKWVAAQLKGRPASRVIFLYPTRASATEGFRDYVSWAGPEVAALLSGTSQYDLEGMFGNPADARFGRDYTVAERLFALAYWHRRVFSATVDSFLAFVSSRYAPMCMVPLLADSVIVFDEVHSFDNSMFRALEGFLRFFDAPALCMTASLPQDRVRVLRDECGMEVFPDRPARFADLHRQSEAPRYGVQCVGSEQSYSIARRAVEEGKRVLWVVNRVQRCQTVAQRLEKDLGKGTRVLCYHSRFRLKDRRCRHEDVITLFRSSERPAVVVSTQVCEMSLDLDADVLITEAAEVPALIQRMGRCCREPDPSPGRIGEVYIYRPEAARPYTAEEVEEGASFAQELGARGLVAHADLARYLSQLETDNPFAAGGFTSFVDSGWYAMGRDDSFREDDEFAIDCVLDSDVAPYLEERAKGTARAAGFIVPAPRYLTQSDPRLGPYLRLVPSSAYSERLGFLSPGEKHHA